MSSGAASREAHTRLYVNNNYEGLYTIVEWLDTDFLQKHFGENSGHMYKFVFDNDAALAGWAPFTFQLCGTGPGLVRADPVYPGDAEGRPTG